MNALVCPGFPRSREWQGLKGRLPQTAERLKNGQPRIVYYDDDEGGVLQTRTKHEGEEIKAARRLWQFFRDEAPMRA